MSEPLISVLLPCRNALPWLPDAVGSVLAQRNVLLELLCVDDNSQDGSREWLVACSEALERRRASGAAAEPCTCYDDVVCDAAAGRVPWQADSPAVSPEQVAAWASPTCSLRVLVLPAHGLPSGQGLALNTALQHARGQLVGEMEKLLRSLE